MKGIEKLQKYVDTHISLPSKRLELSSLIDRIKQELNEWYIALPLDVDGVPIHVGDELVDIGDTCHRGKVRSIELREDGWIVFVGSLGKWSHAYRHIKPDSWESIIYDAMQAGRTEETIDVTPLIDRCKALHERTKGGDTE